MQTILKQVAGIDVAQKELVVCLGRLYHDCSSELYAHKTFTNTPKGFADCLDWAKKNSSKECPIRFVMEATGVYHEAFTYFLEAHKEAVSVVLPNKISNYMRTLPLKTVTDKTASQAIARFGLERMLDDWQRPLPVYKQLRQLTREREQLIAERTMAKNQLHAEQAEAAPNSSSIVRIQARITLLNKQEKEIKAEIAALITADKTVAEKVTLLCSIPGIGKLTAATILAETNGFELIRNRRQLASYAGFDVQEKQSGTSVKGKPHISKKGNRYLRKAMHLPALAAIRSSEAFKAVFTRLVSKHGIKMKAAVAVQRKLLELTYTICKRNKKYSADEATGTTKEAVALEATAILS